MFTLRVLFPVKASPSKKSRGGGQGGLRRAPTLNAPTPLSHTAGQPSMDPRIVYYPHFKSTESEGEAGKWQLLVLLFHQPYSGFRKFLCSTI